MFGFGQQPDRVTKRSIEQSRDRRERQAAAQGNYYQDDDGLPQESILDDPAHKEAVVANAYSKYISAKQTYETTREPSHWQYMQQCITEYEKAIKS